ncbi:hypothetical protein BDQ17DRAFT_1203519, partial [Cyathus striatus]
LGAGHCSAECLNALKCHPETQKAVINDIMSWVNSKHSKECILWLNGPAGAGKLLILQTMAEICENQNKLILSFFFS